MSEGTAMTASKELTARQRARAARSAQLAARAEQDKRVEDLYTRAFAAVSAVAAARAAVEAAELQLAAALAALGKEGESQQDVAQALELPAEEVRRLTRAGREVTAGSSAAVAG
jgi:hypothetical protein